MAIKTDVLTKAELSGGGEGILAAILPRAKAGLLYIATRVLPPLLFLVLLGLIWELACSQPGASLPPPSKVVAVT